MADPKKPIKLIKSIEELACEKHEGSEFIEINKEALYGKSTEHLDSARLCACKDCITKHLEWSVKNAGFHYNKEETKWEKIDETDRIQEIYKKALELFKQTGELTVMISNVSSAYFCPKCNGYLPGLMPIEFLDKDGKSFGNNLDKNVSKARYHCAGCNHTFGINIWEFRMNESENQ